MTIAPATTMQSRLRNEERDLYNREVVGVMKAQEIMVNDLHGIIREDRNRYLQTMASI